MTESTRSHSRHRLAALGMALAIPALTGMTAPVAIAAVAAPPTVAVTKPVPVHAVKTHKPRILSMPAWHKPTAVWPSAGTATADLPASGMVRAGRLPVRVGPAGGKTAITGSAVSVSMRSRQDAARAGVTGVIFTLRDQSEASAVRRVRVSLDYGSFAYADGGNYASRLRIVELPECVLTTPQLPACRVQTPSASANDVRTSQLTAVVPVTTSPDVVLAATTSTSGSSGDYTATPLSEAGNWAEGGSSGAFTYSYPIQVPPVPGKLEPDVALNYNSQAVDGLTSSTNNQASWIGDGFDYSPGYVERNYQSCETEPPGATNWVKSGDLCLSSNDVTTLSLNGVSTTLVQDGSTGAWHAESDGNEKIQYLSGAGNATNGGDYWVITEPDGTKYYFGQDELPGWASGDKSANSSWNVPVYEYHSGDPCYNATASQAHCYLPWRWNLDYVTDSHGNAMALFYNYETNYYAEDNGTTGSAAYQQGGALATIEYGLRAGSVYGSTAGTLVTPAAQVNFTTGTSRTDIPSDLACSSGATCDVISPTFWSKYQLTSISTQTLEGSSLANVDSWALNQTYPSTGDPTSPASLWLSSITRTGNDTGGGGSAVSVPAVTFAGKPLANRVMTATDTSDGYSIITRMRMTQITEETGGQVGIAYDTPGGACTSGSFPSPDANTDLCYPDYWTPSGVSSPVEDWFNKYVVKSVTEDNVTVNGNTIGGGVPVQTSYSYSGAAWHYDDDTLTRSQQRTWDQWRGFRTVTTETGTSPDPVTQATDTYLQGMDGDDQSGGGTSSVSVTDSRGDTVTDSAQYAGMKLEHIVYDGVGGSQVSDTITIPWSSAATATRSQPSPLPALTAHLTGTAETKSYTPLASGGTRESDTTYTHDSYGRVTKESDVPDTSDSSEDTCTTTSYADNTSAWILDLKSEVSVVSVPCTATPSLPNDAVSDDLTFYDGSTTLGAAPTKGDVTETEKATSYSGSTPVYAMQTGATYDEYGRVLTSTDADNRTTTTAYTPMTGAEPTSVKVTDPVGLVTTTSYDPARDLAVQTTDPAGYITSETYDGLGRLTAVWLPGHAKASASADYKFAYTVSDSAPSVVTTSELNEAGGYTVSEELYDSLGRQAETQSATPDGGRDITDTYYNSLGLKSNVSDPYYTTGAPDGTLYAAPDDQVPSQTGYTYDGDGRVTAQISYSLASETWETDTAYEGNATTVTYKNLVAGEPNGGTPETTFTNGEGLTSDIYQYHSEADAALGPSAPASDYDATSYTYYPSQKLEAIKDAAGNQWKYGYDLLGDQTTQDDPDSGSTTSVYDPASQLMSVTDARGKTVSYTYDADGRKKAEYDTTNGALESSSTELASWTYDTIKPGLLTSSSSYYNGSAYTNEVTGYTTYGLPNGSKTIIPSSEGALAGTYTAGYTYQPNTMALASTYDSAAGGLPAETVNTGYDTAGNPVSLGSSLATYVSTLAYTEYAQPQKYTLGPSTSPVYITDAYDQQTQRLKSQQVETGSNSAVVDATSYAYDNTGNVLSESDTPSSGPAQVQCFQYDYLGRLSQAWSQGSSGCASSPSSSVEGGAAPYWDSYSYDVTGNLKSQVSTQPSGSSVTTTNSFPSAGSAQPHAVASSSVSGGGTISYSYDASGHLQSVSGAQSQTLSWDDAGRLSQLSGSGGSTSYVYGADGTLLLQKDPGSTTLYLADEQIVLNTSSGALSGTRYYSVGGRTVAARTSSGSVSYLAGDREGTSLVAVDSSTMAVTRRYYDPYGNQAGAAPSAWPGTKGFVGGTADPSTGLENLGAREYQPGTGSFVSPDSLLSPYDPQDLNPYAYAQDTPPTGEDPSGLFQDGGNGQPAPCGSYGGGTPSVCVGGDPGSGSGSGGGSAGTTDSGLGPVSGGLPCNILGENCGFPGGSVSSPSPRVLPRPDKPKLTSSMNGLSSTCGMVAGRPVNYHLCHDQAVNRAHPAHFTTPWSWLKKHWRGVAQVGITVVAGVGLVVCTAGTDGLCIVVGEALGLSRGLSALYSSVGFGVGAGEANYQVSSGPHTGTGYLAAGVKGGAFGLVGGTSDLFLGGANVATRTAGGFMLRGGAQAWVDSQRPPQPAEPTVTGIGVAGSDSFLNILEKEIEGK